ncbi:MAG TPA: serine protease [Candidatus Eremiobacteraceae bacterium]|nr:serine protease [Candidatus Eremiobacteraceae bacterium]
MRRIAIPLSAVAALIALWPQRPATADNDVPAWRSMQYSVAMIEPLNAKGEPLLVGSGFCIYSDRHHSYFATADHVIMIGTQPAQAVRVTLASDTSHPYSGRVLRWSADPDIAVVEADVPRVPHATVSLAVPPLGTRIAYAGFPYIESASGQWSDLQPSLQTGTVSSLHSGIYAIAFEGQVDHGNSGGPLFDPKTGAVYGVVDERIPGDRVGDEPSVVYEDVAISMIVSQPFFEQPPVKLDVQRSIWGLWRTPPRKDDACVQALEHFDEIYSTWLQSSAFVESASTMAMHPGPHTASSSRLAKWADHAVADERSAAGQMQTTLGSFDPGSAARQYAVALTAAVLAADAADRALSADLSSTEAYDASVAKERAVGNAAGGLETHTGCETDTQLRNS